MKEPSTALDCLFKPRAVAVIGASRTKGSIGREILHNLMEGEFTGKVFPVNPHAEVIHSIKCYASVRDIEDRVDLAVVAVHRDHVLTALADCGEKGVRGVVVITAGFREIGAAGRRLEDEAMAIVRRYGMRMVGPNCMGIINTHPAVSLNATFSPTPPRRGRVAFLSQSGAMGVAILNLAQELGLGFSYFVSMGNKADVSGNDLLEYWADDPDTDVILMYLESFGNPRRFTRIARRLTRHKPLIAVKSGRTAAGARAASSHTGALAGADVAVDALFDQFGVIRVDGVDELFDLASCFVGQPRPRGDRVAIVSNAGGPGILATDACIGHGLNLAELSEETRDVLREALVPEASVHNPVDMVASAGPRDYAVTLDAVLADPNVDSVIVIDVPPVAHDTRAVVTAASEAARKGGKPVLGCFMAREDVHDEIKGLAGGRLSVYRFPESAARALARFTHFYQHHRRPIGRLPEFPVDRDRTAGILATARAQGRVELTFPEACAVLEAYGIPVASWRTTRGMRDAVVAARAIGYPVVLKLLASGLSHKSDAGGVLLDVRTDEEVEDGFHDLIARAPPDEVQGVVVQKMVRDARETIIGMTLDPSFGPLIMFGLGGIYVEVFGDVSFGVHPITDLDADRMIDAVKGAPLLMGVRGEEPVDRETLREVLLRVSQLVGDFDEIAELDVNPFMASPRGGESWAADARITLTA